MVGRAAGHDHARRQVVGDDTGHAGADLGGAVHEPGEDVGLLGHFAGHQLSLGHGDASSWAPVS